MVKWTHICCVWDWAKIEERDEYIVCFLGLFMGFVNSKKNIEYHKACPLKWIVVTLTAVGAVVEIGKQNIIQTYCFKILDYFHCLSHKITYTCLYAGTEHWSQWSAMYTWVIWCLSHYVTHKLPNFVFLYQSQTRREILNSKLSTDTSWWKRGVAVSPRCEK